MSEASNSSNPWESWLAGQQALIKSMFPSPLPQESADATSGDSLQTQFSELRDAWKESIEKWSDMAQRAGKAPAFSPESLQSLFAPERWAGAGVIDGALKRVLDGPKFATLFDQDRQLLELQRLATRRDQDVAAFQAVLAKGWTKAYERVATQSLKQPKPESWRAVADGWLSMVNDSLIELYRSDEFVEAQRKMLRSASDYRLQERKIAEAWCEVMHVPTRTEVDELQRSVVELRREVRRLRQAQDRKPATVTPKPAAKRTRTARA